jgi:hypothetical protein
MLLAVASVTGASAGDAWVLWIRESVIDPNSTLGAPRLFADGYTPDYPTHATKEECVTAGRAYIARVKQPETLKAWGLEEPSPRTIGLIYAYPIGRRDQIVRIGYECWPDTIDPRGPKR